MREGPISLRFPEHAQHAKRYGEIEITRPGQNSIGVNSLDVVFREILGSPVDEVIGDAMLSAAADHRRREMLAHGILPGAHIPPEMRHLFKQVQRLLVENPFDRVHRE